MSQETKSFLKSIWEDRHQSLFLHSESLTHGVMVTLLILVQSFKVRILMGQQSQLYAGFFISVC
jgi:hypothetical protein